VLCSTTKEKVLRREHEGQRKGVKVFNENAWGMDPRRVFLADGRNMKMSGRKRCNEVEISARKMRKHEDIRWAV